MQGVHVEADSEREVPSSAFVSMSVHKLYEDM
jgi:hypothetical protein